MNSLVETQGNLQLAWFGFQVPGRITHKRILDIILSLLGIIVLSPLLVICFILTKVSSPGPAVFRHRRVGFNGVHFDCLKFRTMVTDAPERLRKLLESDPAAAAEWDASRKLRRDPRVTAVGSFLRKWSLDELPQLFNVLSGEMSLVGPRPVTDDELQRYSSAVHAYLACRPGITGLWQVSGRSTTTYAERVAHDAFYARNWSVALDAKILILTVPAVFSDTAF